MQMGSMEFVAPALEELLPELSLEEQPRLQNQSRERDRIRKRRNKHSPPPRPSLISVQYVMDMGSMGMDFVAPALEELLPDLSREEQLRLQNKSRGRDRISKPRNKHAPRPRPSPFSEWDGNIFKIPQVLHALAHYNARHPGGEFDVVKPLKQSRVGFRGQAWFHVNFWARPRSSSSSNNKTIKRFFAEVHYKPTPISSPSSSSSSLAITAVPIVEICIIIEEPLSQYRRSCAFCPSYRDILHPKGCRKFVCGNDKDRFEQRLDPCCCTGMGIGKMPFTARPDMSAFLNISPK